MRAVRVGVGVNVGVDSRDVETNYLSTLDSL